MADISQEILFQIFDFLPCDQFYFILEKAKGLERVKNAFLKKYRIINKDWIYETTYILLNGRKVIHSFFDQPAWSNIMDGQKSWYRLGYLHEKITLLSRLGKILDTMNTGRMGINTPRKNGEIR